MFVKDLLNIFLRNPSECVRLLLVDYTYIDQTFTMLLVEKFAFGKVSKNNTDKKLIARSKLNKGKPTYFFVSGKAGTPVVTVSNYQLH